LKADSPVSYAFLMFGYIALNRLDEAKATYGRALERKLYSPFFLSSLYQIAFLQNDVAGMAQQIEKSAGHPAIEDTLLANEADTAAYSGRLRKSQEFSQQAIGSAERAGEKETAASYFAMSGVREALFGNGEEARRRAVLAMHRSAGVDVQYGSALALAYAGEDREAQSLTDALGRRLPEATIVQFNYLPTIRAKLAIRRGNTSAAIESLNKLERYGRQISTGGFVVKSGRH